MSSFSKLQLEGGEQSVTLFLLFFLKKKERQSKLLSYNGTSVMQLCELGLHGQKHYCLPGKLKRPPIKIRSKTAFLPRRLGPARVFQAEFVVTLSIRSDPSSLCLPATGTPSSSRTVVSSSCHIPWYLFWS